jgi:hypothetical protein
MLWDEHIERCLEGYRYSRFCELYRSWASRLSVTMRQAHTGGDKLCDGYAGDTVPVIVDRLTEPGWFGADFRSHHWRLQFHLCRGELDTGAGRLDRCAYPNLRSARCRAQAARARKLDWIGRSYKQ